MMKVVTSRFGELIVDPSLIIRMTKPVLGFEELRQYIIVETDDFEPFKWYQSIEDGDVAFVIADPLVFFPDYMIEVNPKEVEELKVRDVSDVITYAIVTIPPDYTKMTANLQGPIVINARTNLAKQLVLVNSQYGIRHRLIEGEKTVRPKPEKTDKVLAPV